MNALAEYYARRAPEYDRIYEKPERQTDLLALRQSVSGDLRGRRVLEVACGTGWWTEVLSGTARSITATDISDEVLAVARARNCGSPAVTFQRCDAWQLGDVTGSFDAALGAFWWSHLAPAALAAFLDGLHGRLETGSRVVFIDNLFVPGSSTPLSRRDAEGNTFQRRPLGDGSVTEVLKNFPTEEEIVATLRGHAEGLTVRRLTYYWLASYTVTASRGRR